MVSRCSYAMENGAEILSGCIRRTVDELLQETARRYGREPEDAALDCLHASSVSGDPHEDAGACSLYAGCNGSCQHEASDCQISIHPQGELLWLPNIGGFVGSDTVGCVLASGLDQAEETTLLVDIGTNGEIVLGGQKRHDSLLHSRRARL